ncbi:hypothetical protein CLV58_115116 [Spirosoma oryzae]|uniref:Uncharacterized protein n=1 Tax=Spirosoma oryzae TaxID=1469603 RepID=A0A2T0SNU0_9BACT|nr:hypothetical protein [Spirosoma oryzae]PRY35033.1 hypothetical protein CLV58_115116 [Spirosoma oryzae]
MQSSFRYGVIKNLMVQIINQIDEAGYADEAQAMGSLTHVIGSRIEPIDTANSWGVDYQTECLIYQRDLLAYLTRTDQPLLPVN